MLAVRENWEKLQPTKKSAIFLFTEAKQINKNGYGDLPFS